MGPRPEDRGEDAIAVDRTEAYLLQWGHGPKTVERISEHTDRSSVCSGLQWGHGPKTVES